MSRRLNDDKDFALLVQDVGEIKKEVLAIKTNLEDKYVTQLEFAPVRNIVYGLVGVILLGVISALIGLVIVK